MSFFKDKVLLITGGSGSFGRACVDRFLDTDIKEIRVFSRDEAKHDAMRHDYKSDKINYFIGDIREYDSVKNAMRGVDYVFHAAAIKEVPSAEFFPIEAVKTNILGADNVINAAVEEGIEGIVCLSTDKAAYPINAMGMTKAVMEKLVVAKTKSYRDNKTLVCSTRYGNVMASRGSVIPLFINQIKTGQPLTITEPLMTRFLMSLPEAIDLVMYAFEHADPGDLLVRKAPASTIGDLAQALLELFDADNEIKIIGKRHGEKMYETLVTEEEMAKAIDMGDYYRIPADTRNLNYDVYFKEGAADSRDVVEQFNSDNAKRLNVEEVKELLLTVDYVREELENWKK
ncbi:polysaccharide biosynthesis protein [Fastidiosipila sanguinis]|uniref:UDP-glucose 4-epimerase n=1 Tax=Fastidiosipila sanguinis TaxID=236753 RepID=A0A2S0KLC7_9FIRM|nr:polysaccharide biosynthesis protein [Fastidiosipila sanguinis]AVM41842.1 UDP-glucose 4-epimerase [Fastidiosipila sanguinis]